MQSLDLLLLTDIPGIGERYQIVRVPSAYALNELLPHRNALVATASVRKRFGDAIRNKATAALR